MEDLANTRACDQIAGMELTDAQRCIGCESMGGVASSRRDPLDPDQCGDDLNVQRVSSAGPDYGTDTGDAQRLVSLESRGSTLWFASQASIWARSKRTSRPILMKGMRRWSTSRRTN
jgi:hypothetical protein